MPHEIRHLLFSPREYVGAVQELRRRRGCPLPAGSVRRVEIAAEPALHLCLTIAPDDAPAPCEATVDATELAAALVSHCIRNGIPIPADAAKSVHALDDELVLVVNKGLAHDRLAALRVLT